MIIGNAPKDLLPIKPGDTVIIPKGTLLRSTRPGESKFTARRTYRVQVKDIYSGYDARHDAYALRKHHTLLRNPEVVWAGTGGYWTYADVNDVKLPGHEKTIGEEITAGEVFVTHDYGACEVLFCGAQIVAGKGFYTGERVRYADVTVRERVQEFFATANVPADDVDLEEIPARSHDALHDWVVRQLFARRAEDAPDFRQMWEVAPLG